MSWYVDWSRGCRLFVHVLALFLLPSTLIAGAVATGPGPHAENTSKLNPHPAIWMDSCPWLDTALSSAGYNAENGWNFAYKEGEDLRSKIVIKNYDAFVVNAPDVTTRGGVYLGKDRVVGKDCGGAVLYLEYNPGDGDPTSIHWVQAYNERLTAGGTYSTYLDNGGASNPWYDTKGAARDTWFLDRPYDVCCCCPGATGCNTDVEFQVFIAVDTTRTVDGKTVHDVTLYDGLWWGYEYTCTIVPLPSAAWGGMALLGVLFVRRVRT